MSDRPSFPSMADYHSIPDDILMLVFEALLEIIRGEQDHSCLAALRAHEYLPSLAAEISAPVQLQGVCRRVRDIVRHLPALWTTATDGMRPDLCSLFLRRSAQMPLCVVVRGHKNMPPAESHLVMQCLMNERHRWRAMYVSLPQGPIEDPDFGPPNDRSFPLLAQIVILDEQPGRSSYPLEHDPNLFIARWTTPRLTSALLYNMAPHGDAMRTLTSLQVLLRAAPLNPYRLWDSLRDCAALKYLHISSACSIFLVDFRYLGTVCDPVCLPSLKTFVVLLAQMRIHEIRWLFASFRFPSLKSLSVSVLGPMRTYRLQFWLDMVMGRRAFACEAPLTALTLDLVRVSSAERPRAPSLFADLFKRSQASTLESLCVGVKDLCFSGKEDMAALENFPRSLLRIDLSKVTRLERHTLVSIVIRAARYSLLQLLKVSATSLYNDVNKAEGWEKAYTEVKYLCDWLIMKGMVQFTMEWVDAPAEFLL